MCVCGASRCWALYWKDPWKTETWRQCSYFTTHLRLIKYLQVQSTGPDEKASRGPRAVVCQRQCPYESVWHLFITCVYPFNIWCIKHITVQCIRALTERDINFHTLADEQSDHIKSDDTVCVIFHFVSILLFRYLSLVVCHQTDGATNRTWARFYLCWFSLFFLVTTKTYISARRRLQTAGAMLARWRWPRRRAASCPWSGFTKRKPNWSTFSSVPTPTSAPWSLSPRWVSPTVSRCQWLGEVNIAGAVSYTLRSKSLDQLRICIFARLELWKVLSWALKCKKKKWEQETKNLQQAKTKNIWTKFESFEKVSKNLDSMSFSIIC